MAIFRTPLPFHYFHPFSHIRSDFSFQSSSAPPLFFPTFLFPIISDPELLYCLSLSNSSNLFSKALPYAIVLLYPLVWDNLSQTSPSYNPGPYLNTELIQSQNTIHNNNRSTEIQNSRSKKESSEIM